MTTTIAPSSGAAPLFTQQGTGTTPGYSALDDRRSNLGALQEGVLGTSTLVTAGGVANVGQADFMVTQRNSGANMSVDINMPSGGFAWVQGDTIGGQGLYCVPVAAANINETIATADATNPRVDQLILEVLDNVLDASGSNLARTRVLTGTPTGGATLGNRSGAVALPGSALLLADILVLNSSSSVPNSNIRDRRKWARGAYSRTIRTGADYTVATTTATVVDSTNLQPRIECSGAPIRATLRGVASHATPDNINVRMRVDGADIDGLSAAQWISRPPGAAVKMALTYQWELLPAAGSHLIAPYWSTDSGTATMFADTSIPLTFTLEEIVRSNAQNSNGVTTG